MTTRLGELLLSAGKISQADLDEALASQVVHGGRLGTNLLELGLLSEKDLAAALGAQHQVAHAAGEMAPHPDALAGVELAFCDDADLLPMRVEATRLKVATMNPRDDEALQKLAFRAGKRVVPVVVCEFRMHQLLRRWCKSFRPLRAIDLEGPRTKQPSQAAQEAPQAEDLMSEEAFQSLYAQVLSGGASATDPVEAIEISEAAPEPEPAPAPIEVLDFASAQKALSASPDREHIARTVLRFAAGRWKRALLLSVQRSLVTGWHGVGEGIREQAVRRIAIPLRGTNTFKLVRDTRAHFVGPMRRDAGTALFYKLLGGGYPSTAVLLPLLARGKVVHFLYVDDGPGQLTSPDVGELLILSQSVARSYEALIRQRAH